MKLLVDNKQFDFFVGSSINLNYNSIASSFSFQGLKQLSPEPLSYNKCEIYDDNDELLITGTIVNSSNSSTSKPQLNSLSGYSLPGVLEDSTIPVSLYPLQSDNLTLKQIVDKLLAPFELKYVVTDNVSSEFNSKYKKTNSSPDQKIKAYINSLASQKGIILTHDNAGRLVFTRIEPQLLEPVATFSEGNPGIMEFALVLNGQAMHSEITVMRQASTDNPDAGEATIKNPYVDVFRPKTKILTSGDIFDVEKAARNELGSELEQGIRINIKTTKFVKPGNLIQVKFPSQKINKMTEFFVQQTGIIAEKTGLKYTLLCVLTDVYTNRGVQNIFELQDYSDIPRF
jgi:prophage tail gpP-like protein